MKQQRIPIFIGALALAAATTTSAFADPGHGRARGHDRHDRYERVDRDWRDHDRRDWRDHRRIAYGRYFNDRDRVVVRSYYGPRYTFTSYRDVRRWHRPWHVGRPLPRHVRYHAAPWQVVRHLPPAPYGYQYVTVDRDVLLISLATRSVIDAMVLLSAR